jgi:hypothetical protein
MSNTEHNSPQPLQIAGIEISVAEQTPLVLALLAVIQRQEREIQDLRNEIHRLKGTTQRPKIEPSRLLKPPPTGKTDPKTKRPGSAKRQKTKHLKIDDTKPLYLDDLPDGSRLEGYRDFVVQDLVVKTNNVRYRRAVYRLPDGSLRVAPRPDGIDTHFGVGLREHILWQVHQNHVTQGRLLEELHELGIDISAGQISNILLQGHDAFHAEKDELLPVAREVSDHLHCDDTSARHCGKPAVCTHIGNEWFASFTTTESKSRLNFLRLLCQPAEQYRWCEEALVVLELYGAGQNLQQRMAAQPEGCWLGREAWEQQLQAWNLTNQKHRTLVSEAALCGTLLTESWYDDLGLISDDAPQFKIFGFVHGLCWVHGERKIDRLIPVTDAHTRECGWPDGSCGTGRAAVDPFEGKSPLEPPPWGRLLRRTFENAVILACTVSGPLGWRRKKTLKRNPAGRVRWLVLQEFALRVPTAARGTDAYWTGPTRQP